MTKTRNFVYVVCLTSALAGLLFGLDIAYVNGALIYIKRDFHLDQSQEELIAGYLLAGAALGSVFSGWLSRRIGRKKTLIFAALMFTVFTVGGILSQTFSAFLYNRFLIGVGVGVASFIAPLYLSEIAPYKIRGGLIATYQLMITIGILLMFISNYELSHTESWRIMLSVLLIPSVFMLISCMFLPESPKWLMLKGKQDKARKVLLTIRDSEAEVDSEINDIRNNLHLFDHGFKLLKQPYFIKVIILGILLQALQQFSGMNAFMYYSGQIFESAGFHNPNFATIIVGIVNVGTTLIAIKYVDKIGRKPIMYFGITLLVISAFTVGYIFHIASTEALTSFYKLSLLIFCLLFIFAFALSLGPVIWIICSEIFPLNGRDLGVTFSTTSNWICNTIIGSYTLTWFSTFGVSGTFWFFGFMCMLGFILIRFFTPETKDISLEKIESNLQANLPLRNIGK
jgi:SP family galactose:H+ symporter-like MFS transporter